MSYILNVRNVRIVRNVRNIGNVRDVILIVTCALCQAPKWDPNERAQEMNIADSLASVQKLWRDQLVPTTAVLY